MRRPILVMLVGWAISLLLAVRLGLPVGDGVLLVVYAGAGAGAVFVVSSLGRHPRGSRAVRSQVVVATLVPMAATVVGVAGAAGLMFVSAHDLRAVLVVLAAAGSTGLAAALRLGAHVDHAIRQVVTVARRLEDGWADRPATGDEGEEPVGPDDGPAAGPGERSRPLPDELARLAAELDLTAARLIESRAREQALEQSRLDLVAWVSHDLRTPLAGIRAMVEALEDGVVDDPETVERYHHTMRIEADRLAGLVDDLFELSRIRAGARPVSREPVPLSDLLSDAIAGVTPAAAQKGIVLAVADTNGAAAGAAGSDRSAGRSVHTAAHGGANGCHGLSVEVSAPDMARVVRNLLDNAIRHTPAGGEVVVESAVDGDDAVVSVRDACGGIADHDLDRVFDLAYRGDRARTPGDDGGAGLGLAIARGLVEAHDGCIEVCNEEPGCRFTVRVPLLAGLPGRPGMPAEP